MIECMIDLETFGLPPDGLMISIGAVKFRPQSMEIMDRFHVAVDPDHVLTRRLARDIDPGTVQWWLANGRSGAREAWNAMTKLDLPTALTGFIEWFAWSPPSADVRADPPSGQSMPVWGNAVTFDVVMMKRTIEAANLTVPWKFYDERCHRTLKTMCPKEIGDAAWDQAGRMMAVDDTTAHVALVDAERQAWQNMILRDATEYHPVKRMLA